MSTTALSRPEPERRPVPLWVVLAVVGGMSCLLLAGYFLFFRQDYALLYKDLRPAAAAAIVEELKKERVPYKLGSGGADILVPLANLDAVRLAVTGADLPGGLNGFELFDSSDMGLTDFAQKIKFQRALQGELTRTILLIDGVADARVHLSLPEKSLFRSEAVAAKASVTLLTKASEQFDHGEIEGIQQLVASAIPDLRSEDVVVLNGRGEVVSVLPQPEVSQATAERSLAVEAKAQTTEEKLAALLQQALPETLFQVRLERAEPAPSPTTPIEGANGQNSEAAADSGEADEPAAASPADLQITTNRSLSDTEQQRVRMTIGDAELVPADTRLLFAQARIPPDVEEAPVASEATLSRVGAEPTSPAPAISAESAPLPPATTDSNVIVIAGLIGSAAFGLTVALVLLLAKRSGRGRPTLALEDRSRFAERLKAGLAREQEAAHDA